MSNARERKPLRLVPKNESLESHSKDIAARAEARAKASKAPATSKVRLLTGDEHALLLNVYRHAGHAGYSYEGISGPHALASAAMDARCDGYNNETMAYEMTIRLLPDGRYEIVELGQ